MIKIPKEYRAMQREFKIGVKELQQKLLNNPMSQYELRHDVEALDRFNTAYDFNKALVVQHQDGSCMTFMYARWVVLRTVKKSLTYVTCKRLAVWTEHCGSFVFHVDDLHCFRGLESASAQ